MPDINIDPSVLNERTDTYSSLTDINGADVFTDIYEEKVERFKNKEDAAYNAVKKKVFAEQAGDTDDVYEQVQASLFTGDTAQVVKETSAEEGAGMSAAVPATGIVCVAAMLLLIRYVEKRRRRWTKDEIDTYIYE